jgi:hypothetical protein
MLSRYPAVKARVDFDLLPVPWLGNPETAEVWALTRNPAGKMDDFAYGPEFARERRHSLTFEGEHPFGPLDDRWPETEGAEYYKTRLRPLLEAVGQETVARRLMVAQYFPYQSSESPGMGAVLPSQLFTFSLVREACRDGKLFVVLHQERQWLRAVPELADAEYLTPNSWRAGSVSPGNLGDEGFRKVLRRITGETSTQQV